jgi:AcrR family transcriptional regulator
MSRKTEPRETRNMDRRVRRTRDALGDALLELMQERKFEDITVQQVLERAGVGRSTFYKHYSDKDDLFLSDLEEFFEMMSGLLRRRKESSHRVAPVYELFAHVAEMRHLHSAIAAADKLRDFQEMGQEYFARAIQQRLEGMSAEGSAAERAAKAQALSGALLAMLSWWLQSGAKTSPAEMDELFHRMVWTGVRHRRGVAAGPSHAVQYAAILPRTKPMLPVRMPRNRKIGRTSPRE